MNRQTHSSDDLQPAWRDPIVLAAAAGAAVQLVVVWTAALPLGVPDEWTWQRISYGPGELASLFLSLFVAVPFALAYLWICRAGDRRMAAASPRHRRFWLAGLAAFGFAWLWVVQESAPSDLHRLGRAPVVHYFPGFSGYFTEARAADDFNHYLADYETRMAEGDVLHIGTHPPGLASVHRGLLWLYERSPALTRLTLATRPASVRETEAMLSMIPQNGGRPLTQAELAELWAVSLLFQVAAAAAIIPLFQLVDRSVGGVAAWRVATFWPLVPAVAVFLPKSDAVFPFIGLGLITLWYRPGPPGVVRAALAGLVFWLGMMLSLAILPVVALAGLLSAQMIVTSDRSNRWPITKRTFAACAVAAAAFLFMIVVTWLLFDLNLLTVWSWNFRNHAGFYDVYHRTYWKWLFVGPFELAIAVGLPVVAAAVASLRRYSLAAPALAALAVCVLLWLSGKNSGESARLWLFLMPWLLWIGALSWQGDIGRRRWSCILPLQLVVSFLTAVRVDGFGFEEFLRLP